TLIKNHCRKRRDEILIGSPCWPSTVALLFVCSSYGLTMLSGCATIMKNVSKKEPIQILTTPEGATIYHNDQKLKCVTPCRVFLDRKVHYHKFRTELRGYEKSEETVIGRSITGWFWGGVAPAHTV